MTYDYQCGACGVAETRTGVPVEERDRQVCACGALLGRVFDCSGVEVRIPVHMMAGGSPQRDYSEPANEIERAEWDKRGIERHRY